MDISEIANRLSIDLQEVSVADRFTFTRGWIANLPPADRVAATALVGLMNFSPHQSNNQILVLIHGIRTAAEWQEAVRSMFDGTNVIVFPIGYEYFDVLRFILPWTRRTPIDRVSRELQNIKDSNPNVPISIIAHSFGTYIVSRVLKPDQGIRLKRLLFCGSIVPRDFEWDTVRGKPERDDFVNDVGTRDIWPVLAQSLSWGYGSSGTFGFKQSSIRDRFHDLTHSDFFSEAWVRKYWLPFICDGTVRPSEWDSARPKQSFGLTALTIFQIKYIFLVTVVGCGLSLLVGKML